MPVGTSLLEAVRKAGLPIASACGASALCGRCGVRVLTGMDTGESTAETDAKRRNRVADELRLACFVEVEGDLEITAPYW